MLESPSFYRLTVWIFEENSPKALFAKPAYYCVHRTLLFAMAGAGGCVGFALSRWSYKKRALFMAGILMVIAVVCELGFH